MIYYLLSIKFPKHILFIFGSICAVAVLISFYFIDSETDTRIIYALLALRGLTVAPAYLFPAAIVPDVISFYYSKFKERKEASFYSILNLLEKFSFAFSLLSSSWLLGIFDYINPYEQDENQTDEIPDSAILVLKYLVSVVPAVSALLSVCFAFLYHVCVAVKRGRYYDESMESDYDDI